MSTKRVQEIGAALCAVREFCRRTRQGAFSGWGPLGGEELPLCVSFTVFRSSNGYFIQLHEHGRQDQGLQIEPEDALQIVRPFRAIADRLHDEVSDEYKRELKATLDEESEPEPESEPESESESEPEQPEKRSLRDLLISGLLELYNHPAFR